ncbi:MAG: hypothetical protein AAB660_01825 [Patescibacteria group bacterium]
MKITKLKIEKNWAIKILLLTAFYLLLTTSAQAQTVSLSGYAWSSLPNGNNPNDTGAGWIKFSGPNYGVVADTFSGNLSGQAWSENFGWLSFDSADVVGCPTTPNCRPNVNPSTGAVTGWARFLAAPTGTTNEWNGWVHLSDSSTYAVTYNSGTSEFSGNAWGENYIGWIKWKGTGYVVTMSPLTPPEATINITTSPSSASWTLRQGITIIATGVGNGTATVTPAQGGTSYTITGGSPPSGYDPNPSIVSTPVDTGSTVTLTPNQTKGFVITYNQSFDYSLVQNLTDVTVQKAGIPQSPPNPQHAVTATRLSGSGQVINLTTSGQPSGVSITYSPLSGCAPTSGTPCVFTVSISVPSNAPTGDYPIDVTATPQGNGPVKIISFTLHITPAPNLISSCSHIGVPQVGENITWTVDITNNPNPQPPYSYYWTGTNLPNTADYPPSGFPTTTSFMISYSTTGSKNATAVVTDNNNNQATCPTDTVNIGVNPGFGEF